MSTMEKTFGDGEIIIKEGDMGNSFFQLLEGTVGVYANYGSDEEVKYGVIEAGQYFGEMAVIESYPRSSTVIAEGSVRVIEIPDTEMDNYLTDHPDKIIAIMKHLGNRIKNMTESYDEAKGLLADLQNADAQPNKDWFSKLIKRHLEWFKNRKTDNSKPSAEALRESAAKVSKTEDSNIETYKKGTIIFKRVRSASACISYTAAVSEYTLTMVKKTRSSSRNSIRLHASARWE